MVAVEEKERVMTAGEEEEEMIIIGEKKEVKKKKLKPIYLRPNMVERLYGLKTRTLAAWRQQGIGPPFIRIDRMVLYKVEDLEAWIEKHSVRVETREELPRSKLVQEARYEHQDQD